MQVRPLYSPPKFMEWLKSHIKECWFCKLIIASVVIYPLVLLGLIIYGKLFER